MSNNVARRGRVAAALGGIATLIVLSGQAQAASMPNRCGAMTAQQRAVALRLLDSITDQRDVSAEYLKSVIACMKGVSTIGPTLVSKADRDAHAELVLLLTAKGIPAP